MKIRKLFSAVIAAAVAVSSLATTSSASLVAVTSPHQGTISSADMWGVEFYASEMGVDYGIDISEISSIALVFTAEDMEWFDGNTGGALATSFSGGDIEVGSDLYSEYTLSEYTYWGVNDEYLGINTQNAGQDILAETISPGYYMLATAIENPLINGDAETVTNAAIYFQEYASGASDIIVVGAYLLDDEANILMSFDGNGTPVDYYYALLTDVIEEIEDNLLAHNSEFSVEFELSTLPGGDLSEFCMSLMDTALYYSGAPNGGDYIYGQCSEYGLSNTSQILYDGTSYLFELNYYIDYYTTKAHEDLVTAKVDEILDSLDLDGKTDYEKICAIYEYVCDTTEYDYDALETDNPLAHSAYGALCLNKAVCQGYSMAIYRLMLEAGIDCRYVTGEGNGEAHGWNIVELDGKYYYIDSTWDSNFDDLEDYRYFLKGLNDFEGHDDQTMYYLYGYDMAETAYVPAPAHVHSIVNHEAKAATCTEIGWNAYETCSECDYTTYVEIAATGHKYTDYVVTEEATCEEAGTETAECDNGCGTTDTKDIDALGHDYEAGEDGYSCKNCGEVADIMYGDANGDGRVNAIDVLLIRKHMVGGWDVTINEDAADVNSDGRINAIDVLLIRKYMVGGWGVVLGPQ